MNSLKHDSFVSSVRTQNIPIAFHENNQNIATLVTPEQKEILTTRKEGLTKKNDLRILLRSEHPIVKSHFLKVLHLRLHQL